jgi:hypothetical protein
MLNRALRLVALSTLGCADAELPSEQPYICGRITSRTSTGWLVETATLSNAPGAEPVADVGIGSATVLRQRDGSAATAQEFVPRRVV